MGRGVCSIRVLTLRGAALLLFLGKIQCFVNQIFDSRNVVSFYSKERKTVVRDSQQAV